MLSFQATSGPRGTLAGTLPEPFSFNILFSEALSCAFPKVVLEAFFLQQGEFPFSETMAATLGSPGGQAVSAPPLPWFAASTEHAADIGSLGSPGGHAVSAPPCLCLTRLWSIVQEVYPCRVSVAGLALSVGLVLVAHVQL